jgi:FkbM family methyltransferase
MLINGLRMLYRSTPSKVVRELYFRSFCALVRNKKMMASIDGITYDLDLGEMIDICLLLKQFEPDVTQAITRYCIPGMTVFDIGANVGAHALHAANNVGSDGRVFAFEPTDFAYRKLLKNIALNPTLNINASQVALSDHDLKRQQINFRSSWRTDSTRKDWPCLVDFMRLDAWCDEQGIDRVDLIKLDVDGNEYSVIMGAESLLTSQHPLILMEVWGPNFSDHTKNPFIVLKQFGYRFFHIDTGEEYMSIDDLKAIVSLDGKLLDHSFSIVAK